MAFVPAFVIPTPPAQPQGIGIPVLTLAPGGVVVLNLAIPAPNNQILIDANPTSAYPTGG